MADEVTARELRVTGTIPRELSGRLLRIGPNPVVPPDPVNYHWFTGNGPRPRVPASRRAPDRQVYDAATNGGEVQILNAQDFTGSPVATIHLPQRVPFGFHGNWVPDAS